MRKEFKIKASDGLELAAVLAEAENPKACVQIIHGLKEHKERYYEFMDYLNEHGFSVIMVDNRGHGASLGEKYPLGYMDGFQKIVDDCVLVTHYMKELHPDLPFYMFGHSFGSMIARCYLEQHDDEIDKLVLSGTVNYKISVWFGLLIGSVITGLFGGRKYNKLMIALGDNDDNDWVNSDPKVMEAYRNDPLCCGYKYQNESIYTVWKTDRELNRVKRFACKNPNLPILSISGELDPCTGGVKGLNHTFKTLSKIGYHSIMIHNYGGLKHELVNTINNDGILADIVHFYSL